MPVQKTQRGEKQYVYIRSHYRALATAKRCEDLITQNCANISMLLFTCPLSPDRTDIRLVRQLRNHHRWYAGVDMLDQRCNVCMRPSGRSEGT
eukprot:6215316-Pyramimonas_sp.AAC.1